MSRGWVRSRLYAGYFNDLIIKLPCSIVIETIIKMGYFNVKTNYLGKECTHKEWRIGVASAGR